ncbi:hypothetical protein ACFWHQ_37920 [Streptomyces sp. NPDC060334]|uniref:hypothetical protein n=1 Tax=unclassified Streptomyces TaxID=2593676 RepID=UPI00365CB345
MTTEWGRIQFGASKAGAVDVPRFAAGHVEDLPGAHPEIDWAQLRTPGSGRSRPERPGRALMDDASFPSAVAR